MRDRSKSYSSSIHIYIILHSGGYVTYSYCNILYGADSWHTTDQNVYRVEATWPDSCSYWFQPDGTYNVLVRLHSAATYIVEGSLEVLSSSVG
jgi:hypothetical protein